jgi:hypothetical protein
MRFFSCGTVRMLRFPQKPDPVFTAILHGALEVTRDTLAELATEPEEDWPELYPELAERFTATSAIAVIDYLLAASREAAVYQLTDYHWLVLYACLRTYCTIHNDLLRADRGSASPIGPYQIGPIDFDAIVDSFFWDTDFLLDGRTISALGPEGRESMGITDEIFGIAQRLPPHPEELKLSRWEEPGWEADAERVEGQGPWIPQYPIPDADQDQHES